MGSKTVYLDLGKISLNDNPGSLEFALYLDKILYHPSQLGMLDHKYIPADAKLGGL